MGLLIHVKHQWTSLPNATPEKEKEILVISHLQIFAQTY